jgi:kynureninase
VSEGVPTLPALDVDRVRAGFARFLGSRPERLHVAAHSHHPWPDVTLDAHVAAWSDAAERHDHKWDHVFGSVLPTFQANVARTLGLSDPSTITIAPNTHELVMRLLSCLLLDGGARRPRILTTDAEFHSFARQIARLEEDGVVEVERVAAQPFDDLPARLHDAAARGGHDLVFVSQVLFDSGYLVVDLAGLVDAVPDDDTLIVIDGYHGYLAVPTDLAAVEHRAFYVSGGYKYAMAGEGSAFLHCPPGYAPRPPDTGWFAGFSALAAAPGDAVGYGEDGSRFLGATFDPSGVYRANAVHRWLADLDVEVAAIHAHVRDLQRRFVALAAGQPHRERLVAALLPADVERDRGHFLTVETPAAGELEAALAEREVVVDHRRDRLRFGFGCYHRTDDLDVLWARLDDAMTAVGWPG